MIAVLVADIIAPQRHNATHYSKKYHAFVSLKESDGWIWCYSNKEWIELKSKPETLELIELNEREALNESQRIFLDQAVQTCQVNNVHFDKRISPERRRLLKTQMIVMCEKLTIEQLDHKYPDLDIHSLLRFAEVTTN